MSINQTSFRNLVTQAAVRVFRETPRPTLFLKSFFPSQPNQMSRRISIDVQRTAEYVAKDVQRQGEGNLNQAGRYSQQIYEPPYYWEKSIINDMDVYDEAIRMQDANSTRRLIDEIARLLMLNRDKINRAFEVQCANVLDTGVISMDAGTNIDFRRKSDSLRVTSTKWDANPSTATPFQDLSDLAEFLRKDGKIMSGAPLNAIFGSNALEALKGTSAYEKEADLKQADTLDIRQPQRVAQGATLHGTMTAGSDRLRIWSYKQYYTDANGNHVPYIDPDKVILLPEQPAFSFEFGAVPQLMDRQMRAPQRGEFYIHDTIDPERSAHKMHTKSAGMPVPAAIDQIGTIQVTG